MRSFVVGLVVLGTLVACDSTTASNANLVTLAQRQAQWEHRAFHSYTFDYANTAPLGRANLHITVKADVVTSVIDATTGMAPEFPEFEPTIDSMFAIAHSVVGAKHATIELEFDSQFGYPTHVSAIDDNPGGGYDAHMSNLQPTR